MSPTNTQRVKNWLLDGLPNEDYERLLKDLQPASFVLLRYTQALITQIAVCNRLHSVELEC